MQRGIKKLLRLISICAIFALSVLWLIFITFYCNDSMSLMEKSARNRHETEKAASLNTNKVNRKYCPKQSIHIDSKRLEQLKLQQRLKTIFVDDKNKVLFCYVPKVASGNWKRVFLILTNKYSNISMISTTAAHEKSLLPCLGDLPVEQIRDKIQNYRSYVMVREPMERLLSAYINKIHSDRTGKFQRLFGAKMLKYTKYKAYIQGEGKWNVTFEEFIRFLTNESEKDAFELHWDRISEFCHPCLLDFDFVGRYEALSRDAARIIKMIDPDSNVTFPGYQVSRLYKSARSKMVDYFKTITRSQLEKLLELYKKDYLLFGYSLPKYLFKVVQNETIR